MVAAILVRLFLGALLVLAALPKLAARAEFARAAVNYQLLPSRLTLPLARVLPVAEICVGAALLVGAGSSVAAAIAAFFFVTFAIAAGVNLARGRRMDCGCHGAAAPRTISWALVTKDALLAVAATFVAVSPAGLALLPWPDRSASTIATSTAVAFYCAAGLAALIEATAAELIRTARLILRLREAKEVPA